MLRFQALQPSLSVQSGAISANPDYAEAGPAAPVLHFNYRGSVNYGRRAVQAGASATDIVSVCILLKRMAKHVNAADAHA